MHLVQHVTIEPDWPEHGYTAEGTKVRLAEVEAAFPAGGPERAGVYFLRRRGTSEFRVYPWKDAGYYVDDAGEPIVSVGPFVGRPMSRVELEGLGLDDRKLDELHLGFFGRDVGAPGLDPESEDTPELQARRRVFFDEVMGAAYGPEAEARRSGAGFTPGKE